MSDARFEDGAEQPLRLIAQDAGDLAVLAALLQDAVFPIIEMTYARKRRRFALLVNRFRWEDAVPAERQGRGFERVQSLLVFEDVVAVQTQGIDRADKSVILSVLDVGFIPGEDGMGRLDLTLAGDGMIGLSVEALNVSLRDVTRPYLAPSRHMPTHD